MSNFGFLSLIPVLLAVTIAIKYKNVVLALFASVLTGVLILVSFSPVTALTEMIGTYFFAQLQDSYNAGVLVLLVFIGGFIALMEKSGGALAFASKASTVIKTRAKVQVAAWIGGIIIFFSDLGTPLIVGPIFEPLFDKLKVSKEKLAYIIDSTASPVAVLVPFIGWGVYIMGLIQKEYELLGIQESDWTAFVKSIPFNIYSILAVFLVPLIAFSGYEFGAMAKAEKRVQETGEKYWSTSKPMRKADAEGTKESKPSLVFLPLLVLFVTLFGILTPQGFPFKQVPGSVFRSALSTGYLLASAVLILMMVYHKVKSFEETFSIYLGGMAKMMNVAVILVLAWSLSAVSKELGTSSYIVSIASGNLPAVLVPAVTFLIGAVLSFATGSSWGTYAILMPLVIPMATALGAPLYASIGAVLSGGMFGDHCSPISDTTILSSSGVGCDHMDHVKTQMPYALLNGGASLMGYFIAGITGSVFSVVVSLVLVTVFYIAGSKYKGIRISEASTLKAA